MESFLGDFTSISGINFHQDSLSTPTLLCNDIIDHEHRLEDNGFIQFPVRGLIQNHSPQFLVADQSDEESPVEGDYFDGVFKYIRQMLLEEDDLEERPCMFHDCMALQATEKSFHDALISNSHFPPSNFFYENSQNFDLYCGDHDVAFDPINSLFQSSNQVNIRPFSLQHPLDDHSCLIQNILTRGDHGFKEVTNADMGPNNHTGEKNPDSRKGREREENGGDDGEGRSSKQFAGYAEEAEDTEKYDRALLCPSLNPRFYEDSSSFSDSEVDSSQNGARDINQTSQKKGPKGGRSRKRQQDKTKEVVDLRTLLIRCSQALATYDTATFDDLIKRIRNHSSPCGDSLERLAHHFANALEARLAGTGASLYASSSKKRISASESLKAYLLYITACPFKRMSNIFANKSIAKFTKDASTIHIIDFGILYGFQWPCLIHGVSLRPGGPPKLRITGVDFPQPGFRPAERVEETGRRLTDYAKRFNVPFEFNAVAKNWDCVTLDDLRIENGEMIVVNCLHRMKNVADETVAENNPRDAVLNLIKKVIKPDLFVLGIVNGTYGVPFFVTRFREALLHFSSMFDMFEATAARENQERLVLEREMLGRDIMNVIACEGSQRIERPETYKQWQVRNQRAGFRQLRLHREIVREVRAKVRRGYHKDFIVDEDHDWMLQAWKGRVLYALSCWIPVDD